MHKSQRRVITTYTLRELGTTVLRFVGCDRRCYVVVSSLASSEIYGEAKNVISSVILLFIRGRVKQVSGILCCLFMWRDLKESLFSML